MSEFLFILYLMLINPIHVIGLITCSLIIIWLLYVGVYRNPYRVFCWPWFKEIVRPGTYIFELRHYYERLRYGISYSDSWDLDSHLLKIIPIGLKHVRDSAFAPDISEKDWNDMINGLESHRHYVDDCRLLEKECPISHKQLEKDFKRSMELLSRHFSSLWI